MTGSFGKADIGSRGQVEVEVLSYVFDEMGQSACSVWPFAGRGAWRGGKPGGKCTEPTRRPADPPSMVHLATCRQTRVARMLPPAMEPGSIHEYQKQKRASKLWRLVLARESDERVCVCACAAWGVACARLRFIWGSLCGCAPGRSTRTRAARAPTPAPHALALRSALCYTRIRITYTPTRRSRVASRQGETHGARAHAARGQGSEIHNT
jgi:hypothetical protein